MSDAQIFQFFSLVYLSIGVGMIFNREFYKKMFGDFVGNASILYLGGVMALVVGFLLVTFHNTWAACPSTIITVLGWLALIKGIVILVQPKALISLTKALVASDKFMTIEMVLVIVIGILFSYFGWCPKSAFSG
jgi:hypothetical protein